MVSRCANLLRTLAWNIRRVSLRATACRHHTHDVHWCGMERHCLRTIRMTCAGAVWDGTFFFADTITQFTATDNDPAHPRISLAVNGRLFAIGY